MSAQILANARRTHQPAVAPASANVGHDRTSSPERICAKVARRRDVRAPFIFQVEESASRPYDDFVADNKDHLQARWADHLGP